MSLLDGLISQVARSAMNQGGNQQNSSNQGGGLGGMLGSVLGAATQSNNQPTNQSASNGLDMGDVLGGLLGGGQQSGSGLGAVLGSVLSGQNTKSGGKGMLMAVLLPLVLNWIQKNGGLSGALSKITGTGLADKAQSWVSAEQPNSNLNPDDVNRLFDKQEIDQVAQQTGTDETQVRQGIAELLPEVINQLTPKGGLEHEADANNEISDILSQLSGTLKNLG